MFSENKKALLPKSHRSRAKGYIYTLEVLIAVSIILVSLVFIFRSSPAKPELETSLIKTQGADALSFLDSKGTLRKLVYDDNETEIETQLKTYLPKNIGFEVQVCTSPCSAVNVPVNETVVAVNYYISGYKENYLGKKVRLWLWRKS
jgi:hypothetical protein